MCSTKQFSLFEFRLFNSRLNFIVFRAERSRHTLSEKQSMVEMLKLSEMTSFLLYPRYVWVALKFSTVSGTQIWNVMNGIARCGKEL